jgi:hypothetical protein
MAETGQAVGAFHSIGLSPARRNEVQHPLVSNQRLSATTSTLPDTLTTV